MLNYHANILDQHRLRHQEINIEEADNTVAEDCIEVESKDIIKHEAKKEKVFIKAERFPTKNESANSVNSIEGINNLPETDDLLTNTPWAMAMNKHLDKSSAGNLDAFVDNVLLGTIVEVEAGNLKENEDKIFDIDTITDLQFTKDDDVPDDVEDFIPPRTSGRISVIQGPEMVFSTEELKFLNKNKIIHEGNLRTTCPVSLFQARVGHYLGTLSLEGMLMIFAAGRKAQNYYHFMTMSSQPFFSELTTRWVHSLSNLSPYKMAVIRNKL